MNFNNQAADEDFNFMKKDNSHAGNRACFQVIRLILPEQLLQIMTDETESTDRY